MWAPVSRIILQPEERVYFAWVILKYWAIYRSFLIFTFTYPYLIKFNLSKYYMRAVFWSPL